MDVVVGIFAATVLVGLSRALENRRCAKVNLCENIARTQFHKDSWGDGITDMASCGITMCRWIAGIHPRIGKFPQICRGPEIIEIWVTALKLSQLCKACDHFIKPASLHYTQPSVLNQDEVLVIEFSLGYTACRLEEGDQLRLHVCSAAHPRWLRHPLQPQGEDWLLGNSEVWRINMELKRQPMDWAVFPKPHTRH